MKHTTQLQSDLWIVTPKPQPRAKLQLFCFPHAGGGIASFSQWIPYFPSEVEVSFILLPGRENRFKEPPYTELNLLIQDLGDLISETLKPPYAFYGHSMGGLISFELARSLRQSNQPGPAQLFISAHRAPQVPQRFPAVHNLPRSEFLKSLGLFEGTPDEILQNEELIDLIEPALRGDLQMCETYQYSPEPPLSCPISVYGGLEDPRISPYDLEEWSIHTRSGFQLHLLEGGHFFIQDDKRIFLKMLYQELNQLLISFQESFPL